VIDSKRTACTENKRALSKPTVLRHGIEVAEFAAHIVRFQGGLPWKVGQRYLVMQFIRF
jgi:hypothetical protein